MAGKIRGITIEIGGDTSGLVASLKGVNSSISETKRQLKDVEKLLKLDPTNTTLLAQKQKLLTQAVEQTKEKLEQLKTAQKTMDAQGVDKNSDQYMALQREIISTTEYLKDLEKQAAQANAVLGRIGAAAGQISKGAQKVATSTRGLSTAAGAALGGIAGLAYNAAVTADDLNTLAKQTGFTTADLQKMQYAADRMDVSMETITGSAARMTRQLIDNEDKFTAIGVATRDASGELRSTTDIFYDTVAALGAMDNATERDTVAMDIFGRSANELAGIVDDGGAALKAYGEEMEALGLVIDQETLDSLNAVNDQIDQIKAQALASFATSGAAALEALSPILTQVIGFLDNLFQKIAGLDAQQIQTITTILAIVAAISPVAGIISKVAGAVSAIMPLISAAIPIVTSIATALAGPLKAALTGALGVVKALFGLIAANPIIAAIMAAIAIFILFGDQIKAILNSVDEFLQNVFATNFSEVFGPVLGGILDGFFQNLENIWNSIKQTFEGVIDFVQGVFTANWQQAWEGVKNIFSGVFNALVSIAAAPINGVIGLVNGAIEAINSLINLINSIPAVNIPNIPSIPTFDGGAANGGTFTRGNILVGEAGPEVLTVQGGRATVTPIFSDRAPHSALSPAQIGGENLITNVSVEFGGSLAQLGHVLAPVIKAETERVGPALVK